MQLRGKALAAPAVLAMTVYLLAACGGGGGSKAANDPASELRQAKATVDEASAIHFTLATAGDHSGSTYIVGGEGDLGRPDKLKGTFTVAVEGLHASVKVASAGGTFLAELPFTSTYTKTDPSQFGIANPAELINPNDGLSTILIDIQNPKSDGQTRQDGEVLDRITGTVPGTDLSALPDDSPSQPVQVATFINPSNHQLREISLTGPIDTKGSATYTVGLTDYGEQVDLSLPST